MRRPCEARFARHRRYRLATRTWPVRTSPEDRGGLAVRGRQGRERFQVKPLAWLEPASDLGGGRSGRCEGATLIVCMAESRKRPAHLSQRAMSRVSSTQSAKHLQLSARAK